MAEPEKLGKFFTLPEDVWREMPEKVVKMLVEQMPDGHKIQRRAVMEQNIRTAQQMVRKALQRKRYRKSTFIHALIEVCNEEGGGDQKRAQALFLDAQSQYNNTRQLIRQNSKARRKGRLQPEAPLFEQGTAQ
jgi:hypothetical protein